MTETRRAWPRWAHLLVAGITVAGSRPAPQNVGTADFHELQIELKSP